MTPDEIRGRLRLDGAVPLFQPTDLELMLWLSLMQIERKRLGELFQQGNAWGFDVARVNTLLDLIEKAGVEP